MGEQPFCEKGCCKRNLWLEPRLGQPRGAAHRAERRGFVGGKCLGGALRRQRKSRSIFRKSDCGAPGGTRTPNDSSEDCCDIHFTTGALKLINNLMIILHYFFGISKLALFYKLIL